MFLGLAPIDLFVVLGFFVVLIGIGLWSMRRIKNEEDYFLAGRGFGKVVQTFAAFGQATSSDTAVGTTTTTFTNGAAGIWSGLVALFATPVYWMTAPWYRRLRLISLGDFFIDRYGSKRMAMVYALIGSIGMMGGIAIGIEAMSKTVIALTPKAPEELSEVERGEVALALELAELEAVDFETLSSARRDRLGELRLRAPRRVISHLNEEALIIVVCLVILIYGVAGGLRAAFLTDTVQGVFIILLSVMLLPFAWAKVNEIHGGEGVMDAFRTLHDSLPESYFEILGSPTTMDFTWYFIAALSVMGVLNVMVQPNQLLAIGSAKDEFTARFGFTSGTYLKRLAIVFWGVLALFALLLYRDEVTDPDVVWGHATLDLLGPLGLGLVGLMIACLMAALMSTADCSMITASNVLTHNVYRPLLPDRSERHYVVIGRVIGGVVVIGGAIIAMLFEGIFPLMKFLWEFYAIFAAAFWLGMLWRPATRRAAWASVGTAAMLFLLLPVAIPAFWPGLRTHPHLTRMTQASTVERQYRAAEIDVAERAEAIVAWDRAATAGRQRGRRPEPLRRGDPFVRTSQLPARGIFWTEGVRLDDEGRPIGRGMLSPGLVALDAVGVDLTGNAYALNETYRILIRIILPFLVLFLVSRLTRHDDEGPIDRFYAKMKTPVQLDREADAKELERSMADPQRFDHLKLLPSTGWEFCRWDRTDIIGFSVAVAVAFVIIGVLFLLVSLGG